jgi:hypothetical protein
MVFGVKEMALPKSINQILERWWGSTGRRNFQPSNFYWKEELISSIWLMLLGRAISFTPKTMLAPSWKISLLALPGKKFPRT